MLRVRAIWSVLMVAACCGVLAAGGAAAAEDQGRSLLSSTAPGAFGVRYLPDRAIMTYTVAAPDGQDEDEDFGLTPLPAPGAKVAAAGPEASRH